MSWNTAGRSVGELQFLLTRTWCAWRKLQGDRTRVFQQKNRKKSSAWKKNTKKKTTRHAGKSKLTLVVDAAVLVLLARHEGFNLVLVHLLSCRRAHTRIHVKDTFLQCLFVSVYIRGEMETHPGWTARCAARRPWRCRCRPCRRRGDPRRSRRSCPWAGRRPPSAWGGKPRSWSSCWPCLSEGNKHTTAFTSASSRTSPYAAARVLWGGGGGSSPSTLGLPRIFTTLLLVGFWPRARMMSATWLKPTWLSPTLSKRPKDSLNSESGERTVRLKKRHTSIIVLLIIAATAAPEFKEEEEGEESHQEATRDLFDRCTLWTSAAGTAVPAPPPPPISPFGEQADTLRQTSAGHVEAWRVEHEPADCDVIDTPCPGYSPAV